MNDTNDAAAGRGELVARRMRDPLDGGFERVVQTLYRTSAGNALLSVRSTILGIDGPISEETRTLLTDWPAGVAWLLGEAADEDAITAPCTREVSVLSVPDELRLALEQHAALGSAAAAAVLASHGSARR